MADGDGERLCLFRWKIENPFFPRTPPISEATFYHGSSEHLTLWTLTLRTMERRLHYRELSLCLSGERYGDPDGVIATRRLDFLVSINDRPRGFEKAHGYVFSPGNCHSIEMKMGVHIPPENRTPLLVILVKIIFPEVANQEGNPPRYRENALRKLSTDLRYLYNNSLYPNMWVRAVDSNTLSVHSYILRANWSHFFRRHFVGDFPVGQTIQTNIESRVLRNILLFVYYGGLNFNWSSDNEMTIMIQMIDRYKLYNLYRIFVADESEQERTTKKDYSSHIMSFTLEPRITDELTYPWEMDLRDPNVKFLFELRVYLRDDDPWYSYSMRATVRNRVEGFVWTCHVQVNLEFQQTDSTTAEILQIESMHEHEYLMRSTEPVESGPCYFEEARSEIGAFLRLRQLRRRRQFRHSIRCILGFSNGNTVTRLQTIHRRVPNYFLETLKVIGYELSRLLIGYNHQDLRVVCESEDPLSNEIEEFRLHKGIFAARVRRWRNAILDDVVGDVIPDEVRCIVGSRAFRYVLHYIYTGTLPVLPRHLYREVVRFASRCQMREFLEYCHNRRPAE